jgi:hypothetical protein
MTKEKIRTKNILSTISLIILLLAIPPIWPYAYYQILRWIITGSALFILYITYYLEKHTWIWIMAIIAILFNPIAPIYFSKETWVSIDLIASIIFLVSIFKIESK